MTLNSLKGELNWLGREEIFAPAEITVADPSDFKIWIQRWVEKIEDMNLGLERTHNPQCA
jgi:hypothetical protein